MARARLKNHNQPSNTMSNQAHKNRTSPDRFNRNDGSDFMGVPARAARYRNDRDQRKADGKAKRAELSPQTNPSGKASYEGKVGIFGTTYKEPKPDPSHAARLRGAEARKKASVPVQKPKFR